MGIKFKTEEDFDNYEDYLNYEYELIMKTFDTEEEEEKEFHYHNPYFEKETEFKKKFILANYIISDLLFK